jgi:hypothetical protein
MPGDKMNVATATLCLLPLFLSGRFPAGDSALISDVFWIDRYGDISWEDEKARLDNFAIQLMNQPNQIGYIYVQAGLLSCRGEAQARAVRAKDYMTNVRGAPWDRIIWRDIGYRDIFEVSLWMAPRGKPPMYVPDFRHATEKHAIQECKRRTPKQKKRGDPSAAPNKRLQPTPR